MADDTPVSRSGKPSGEDSGLANADDTIGTESPVAFKDEVIAELERKDTGHLRAAVVDGDTTWLLRTLNPTKIGELSEAELIELATPIFRARIARNTQFKDELKEASKQYDAVYNGDAWTAKVVTPGSANEQHEQWLDSGTALEPLPRGMFFSVIRPQSGVKAQSSAYELAAVSGHSHGAVVIPIKDGCLRTLCELADQLEVAAVAFVQHIMMPLEPTPDPDSTSPKLSNQGFELNGLAIRTGAELAIIRLEDISEYFAGATQDALDQARVRMSCLRLRSWFVALVTEATRPLLGPAIPPLIFPSISVQIRSFTLFYSVFYSAERLFSDALNVRRLRSVPNTWSKFEKEWALDWLLTVSAFINETFPLAGEIQRLDYEVVTLSSVAALADIKNLRARVARLRADMDRSSHRFRFPLYLGRLPYPENATVESEAPSIHVAPTERELASVSFASEYAWMDKQAAALMVPLNQALQLVVAQIFIEQAEQSTKQTAAANKLAQRSLELSDIMARDSAIGIKNGKRSTQLTLLAAIYLPLTLATGIFGMNIKEINGGTPRLRWVLILAVVLFIPSGCFIAYIWWTSRRDKRLEQQKDQGDQEEQTTRGPEGGSKQVKKE